MAQFTESQLVTIKNAVAFLAETQQAHHSHVAADVQELLNVFNPVAVEEAPAKAKKAKVEEVIVEETPAAE
jgi:DNA uptake protein ComE-like DNA-binding protein